jgi:hypothetical protein
MSARESIVIMGRFLEVGDPSDVATQQRCGSAPRLADDAHFTAREPRVRLADGNPCVWQARTIEIYRRSGSNMERELRTELASRVLALTGREIPANLVYADPDRHMARVSVDGVSFRLTRDQVVLLSPCAYCGVREFESTAIESPADLGYALSAWKPYCRDCTPEDSNDWE